MNEERMQILKMVQDGVITAEEAAKLLAALEDRGRDGVRGPGDGKSRWFRVRVTDLKTGKRKVNVNIPMGLVEVGARLGARFGAKTDAELGDLDLKGILDMVRAGADGKLVDIDDDEEGEHVEVYVE